MNDLALLPQNPVAVLTDEKQYSEFYKRVKDEVSAHVPDLTTAKGRGEIKALAYKVTRTKTAIDDAGKKLNEEAREKINAVDAQRRKIREELDALADEVRRPLTEWEDKEKARKGNVNRIFDEIRAISSLHGSEGSEHLEQLISEIESEINLDPDVFLDDMGEAIYQKSAALEKLRNARMVALKREADQAELARLRAENEAREKAEAEKQAEIERAAREIEAERRRLEIEQERQELAERQAKEREERAAREAQERAEKIAREEREKIQREADDRVAKAEAEATAIREKLDRENHEAEELARMEAARAADRKHRGEIMKAAKEAIMAIDADGISEAVARRVVLAIAANEIPNVRISF